LNKVWWPISRQLGDLLSVVLGKKIGKKRPKIPKISWCNRFPVYCRAIPQGAPGFSP